MTIHLDNTEPITLTKTQRLILANQYALMALLDKRNAKDYEASEEAIRSGYADAIENLFNRVYEGLPPDGCGLVIRSMAMYDALQRSYKALKKEEAEAAGVKKDDVLFPGFSGNDETEYMAYARYVKEREQRFDYLNTSDNFNSHWPMLSRYRAMLPVWQGVFNGSYELSADQMKRLLDTR